MSLIDPTVAPGPPKAAEGAWGLCPVCESGGIERPCWNCGNEEGFTAGIRHLLEERLLPPGR